MVNYLAQAVKIAEIKDREIKEYQGDIRSNYLDTSVKIADEDISIKDNTSISSTQTSRNDQPGGVNKNGNSSEDGSNYIETSGDVPIFSDMGKGGDQAAVDIIRGIDEGISNLENEFGDFESFYEQDENGFWVLKPDTLEAIFKRLAEYFGILMLISLYYDCKTDVIRRFSDSFSSLPPDEGRAKETTTTQTIKEAQEAIMKNFHKAVALIAEKIQAHNDAYYQELLDEAEAHETKNGKAALVCSSGTIDNDEKTRMEMSRDANRNYQDAMNKTIDSLQTIIGDSFHGIDFNNGVNLDEDGDAIFDELSRVEDHTVYTDNGFIDVNKTKEWLVSLRENLVSYYGINKIYVAAMISRAEVVQMWEECWSGRDAGSIKLKAAESVTETESSRGLALFDQFSASVLQAHKYDIQAHYLDLQIEKWETSYAFQVCSTISSHCAIVCGIISFFLPWMAIVATALAVQAAVFNYLGNWYADKQVDDEYTPSSPTWNFPSENVEEGERGNDPFSSTATTLERDQREMEYNLNDDVTVEVKDGYLSVEYGQIAAFNQELASINDALGLVNRILRVRASIARGFSRAFNRIRTGSNSQLLVSALKENINQANIRFQVLTSYYTEIVQGVNWERRQEMNMENAKSQFTWSMAGSAMGAVLGGMLYGGSGASIGASLGQILGSGISGFLNAYYGVWNNPEYTSLGVEFNPDVEAFDKAYRNGESADLVRSIDQDINNINSGIIDFNQSIITSGSGTFGTDYYGINGDYLSGLQERLNILHNVILLVLSNYETMSRVSANWARGFGSPVAATEDSISLVRGKIAADNATFDYLTKLVVEKIQVMNRAAMAKEQMYAAAVKLGISAVVSVAGTVAGAFSRPILSLISPVITLLNSVFDLVNSLLNANADYGKFDKYLTVPQSKSKEEDNRGRHGQNPDEIAKDVARGLDRLQNSLIQVNANQLSDVGNGNWGVNMGMVTENQIALRQISMILEFLTSARKTLSKVCSKISNLGSIEGRTLDVMLQTNQQAALAVLDKQVQSLQVVVQRRNQMKRAQRQSWMAGFQTAYAAVMLAISIATTSMRADIKKTQNNMEKGHGNTQKNNIKHINKTVAKMKTLAWVGAALSVLQSISNCAIGKIFDKLQKQSSVNTQGAEQGVEEAAASEERATDLASMVGGMENSKDAMQIYSGTLQASIAGSQAAPETTKEAAQAFKDTGRSLKNAAENLKQFYSKKKKHPIYTKRDERKIEKRKAAQATKKTPVQNNQAITHAPPVDTNSRTNLQRAYVEMVLNRVLDKISKEVKASPEITQKEELISKNHLKRAIQNGKKIDVLTAQELQQAYENMYKKVFSPLRDKMQDMIVKRIKLTKKVADIKKNNQLSQSAKSISLKTAQGELNTCMQGIEKIKKEIKIYNKTVGKISSILKSKYGKELVPVKEVKQSRKPLKASSVRSSAAAIKQLKQRYKWREEKETEKGEREKGVSIGKMEVSC
jgi:hypothetical protein